MTEFTAENWFETPQSSDKWITKRSRDEEMNKNRKKKAAAPPHNGERRGPKRLYDWTEKWLCGHSGKYRDERDHNLSPRKRRPNHHHPSVKVQCGTYFFLCKVCREDHVKIEYCWEHNGHEPGTVKNMAGSMLPLRVKEWIENRVADGLNWKAIKPLLRVDAMILDKLHFPPDNPRRCGMLRFDCFSAAGKSEEKAFLYTVVLKNLATGKGCPAAFTITPSEAQYAITNFIRWLRVECKFICSVRMIDCSEVEAAGITSGCGFAILLFLCFWKVMKAVAKQAKKSSRCFKIAANSQLRAEAVTDVRRLLNAITTVDFDEILNETHVTYSEHPNWLKYLNTQRLLKKNIAGKWLIDSFYLKLMRKLRVDVLLHILTEQAEPDFRRSDIRITLDFGRPWLSNLSKRNPNIYIHTFTGEDIWYLIKAHDFPSVDNDSDTLTGIISLAVQSPPANSVLSDAVAVEKQATVRCIQDEISTISRLSQTLSTMNLGDSDRATLGSPILVDFEELVCLGHGETSGIYKDDIDVIGNEGRKRLEHKDLMDK
ncbi:hypothetical protein C8J57DRAFT_1218746 [Mycena rebaudengoi]|nr:hypothetical protein C8J57DRAFT_1218746 [Mycena rebaudengoi]